MLNSLKKIIVYATLFFVVSVGSVVACDLTKRENASSFSFVKRPLPGTLWPNGFKVEACNMSGEIAGCVVFHVQEQHNKQPIGNVASLHVSVSNRKQGLGSMLLQVAMAELIKSDCRLIYLTVMPFEALDKDRKKATKRLKLFYARFGFEQCKKDIDPCVLYKKNRLSRWLQKFSRRSISHDMIAHSPFFLAADSLPKLKIEERSQYDDFF